jgi:dTDP-4-amino-4,6-dideoxygalactose transaminase
MIPLVKVGLPNKEKLIPALESVLYSGMIAEGDAVYRFEHEFSHKFGLPYVLAMSSGTAALHSALVLAGIGPGDEVITTSMTAEPTNIAILQAGAKPVFADVDVLSGNIDPFSVADKITSSTKAIMIVHYAGIPVKLHDILEIANKYNIPVIEDCAHALGSNYSCQGIGSFGDFAIFSFQAIKHMTTVDGGMLVIKNPNHITKAKKFRWFGLQKGVSRTEVDITDLGFKYNMNNVTATIGSIQLEDINDRIAIHKRNGQYFESVIPNITGLSVPLFDECADPSYWLYTVLSDDVQNIEQSLLAAGITASKLHRPNHFHSIFKPYAHDLPNLEIYYKKMVHIPCGWWVNEADCEYIVSVLAKG